MKFLSCFFLTFSLAHASVGPKKWVPAYKADDKAKQQPEKAPTKLQKTMALVETTDLQKVEELFKKKKISKEEVIDLKRRVLALSGKAVPILIKVMKEGSYADQNRWVATFLLGRVMGKKAGSFIAKFSSHPNWMMRLASLKTLLSLKSIEHGPLYAKALSDKSMMVRAQALENIRSLDLQKFSPLVWKMLFDKQNYINAKKGRKRSYIIGKAIQCLGDLKFEKAKSAFFKMAQKKRYNDILPQLSYSLEKLTGKVAPKGDIGKTRHFWGRMALASQKI